MASNKRTNVHFVGSIPLPSTEAVFNTIPKSLPANSLKRIPDGETGKRHYFVGHQTETFTNAGVGHVLCKIMDASTIRHDYTAEEIEATMKDFPTLETGYDTVAIESYSTFRKLKDAGIIAKGVKFQACIPTSTQFIGSHVQPQLQAHVEPHFESALLRAIKNIQSEIPHEDLAIQFDLALEFAILHGSFYPDLIKNTFEYLPKEREPLLEVLVEHIVRQVDVVAPDVELGFHLCYGDFGKHHFVEPPDTSVMVELILDVKSKISHPISWIHMPVPKDREDEEYLAPLRELIPKLDPTTELYLGLVIEYDLEGTKKRTATARKVFGDRDFGIATECGMGRRNEEDLKSVLEIESAVC